MMSGWRHLDFSRTLYELPELTKKNSLKLSSRSSSISPQILPDYKQTVSDRYQASIQCWAIIGTCRFAGGPIMPVFIDIKLEFGNLDPLSTS